MKLFVAILSCVKHTLDGSNQAVRDTWLKNLPLGYYDYKFILGDGTPTGDDETFLKKGWDERHDNFRKEYVDPPLGQTAADELVLHVPDSYSHVSYKVREAYRWGLSQGAECFFFCTTDTYVDVPRFSASGSGEYDYCGHAFQLPHPWPFACFGNGVWLSKKAAQIVADSPVDEWQSDSWVGKVLHAAGIELHHDERYTSLGAGQLPPMEGNRTITSHICDSPSVYNPKQMYELHHMREFDLQQLLHIVDRESRNTTRFHDCECQCGPYRLCGQPATKSNGFKWKCINCYALCAQEVARPFSTAGRESSSQAY